MFWFLYYLFTWFFLFHVLRQQTHVYVYINTQKVERLGLKKETA